MRDHSDLLDKELAREQSKKLVPTKAVPPSELPALDGQSPVALLKEGGLHALAAVSSAPEEVASAACQDVAVAEALLPHLADLPAAGRSQLTIPAGSDGQLAAKYLAVMIDLPDVGGGVGDATEHEGVVYGVLPSRGVSGTIGNDSELTQLRHDCISVRDVRVSHVPPPPSGSSLVRVSTTETNVGLLCDALQSPIPVLIEGDTGLGKTATVAEAARRLGRHLVRFNLSSGVTVDDLIGRLRLEKGRLELTLKPFADAFVNGHVLVLDECNLAQEEVLSTLEISLDTGVLVVPNLTCPAIPAQELMRHADFRLVITQNPSTGLFAGKREQLSAAFLSRFRPLTLSALTSEELVAVVQHRVADEDVARKLVGVHEGVHEVVKGKRGVGPLGVLTLRDLLNYASAVSGAGMAQGGWCIYGSRFPDAEIRGRAWEVISRALDGAPPDPLEAFESTGLPEVGSVVGDVVVTQRVHRLWRQLDVALKFRRPVLVAGAAGCGKTAALRGYCTLRGKDKEECHVTPATEPSTMVGQHVPSPEGGSVAVWYDGPVTVALSQGRWILLDNLTSASATVLERLNPVLEESPELYVAEKDSEGVVRAADGFQVLATADTRDLASLSPAMANRFTIICMESFGESTSVADEVECLVRGYGLQDDIKEACDLCLNTAEGAYGLHTVSRILRCSRELSKTRSITLETVRQAIMLLNGAAWVGHVSNAITGPLRPLSARKRLRERPGPHTLAPTLESIAQRVKRCVALRVPVVIIDDHGWGCSKDLVHGDAEAVTASEDTSVSSLLGVTLPSTSGETSITLEHVPGPLQRALGGRVLVIESPEILPHSTMAQLVPLLDTGVLPRPGEGPPLKAEPGFAMVVTTESRGWQTVPREFAQLFAVVQLPAPRKEDYLHELGDSAPEAEVIAEGAVRLAGQPPSNLDMRLFRSVTQRLRVLGGGRYQWATCLALAVLPVHCGTSRWEVEGVALEEALRDVGILKAGDTSLVKTLSADAEVKQDGTNVVFAAWGLRTHLPGDASCIPPHLATQRILRLVVELAFATAVGQSVLLAGPTGCKGTAVNLFSCIVTGSAASTVHLTCATEQGDLMGHIQPVPKSELREMALQEAGLFHSRYGKSLRALGDPVLWGWAEAVLGMERRAKAAHDGSSVFAFLDGPVLRGAKGGEVMLLKGTHLASVGLLVSLRPVVFGRLVGLGPLARAGGGIPLSSPSNVVLSMTCTLEQARVPQPLKGIHMVRVGGYTKGECETILQHALGDLDHAPTIARGIMALHGTRNLRGSLRHAAFAKGYPAVAGVSMKEAVAIGYRILFGGNARRLEDEGWSEEELCLEGDVDPSNGDILGYQEGRVVVRAGDRVLAKVLSHLSEGEVASRIAEGNMMPTQSLVKNLCAVFCSADMSFPLLLEGSPGIGKSFVVEKVAHLVGVNFVRIQFSAGTTLSQLFGAVLPCVVDDRREFRYRPGVLTQAIATATAEQPVWVLLDEFNLAPVEVQQALSPMLTEGASSLPVPHTNRTLPLHHVRIFAAVNPAAVGGGRSHIPPSLRDLFVAVRLSELSEGEVCDIAKGKFQRVLDFKDSSKLLPALFTIHSTVLAKLHSGLVGKTGARHILNLRTLEKVMLLLASRMAIGVDPRMRIDGGLPESGAFFFQVLEVIYAWRFPSKEDRAVVLGLLSDLASELGIDITGRREIRYVNGVVHFGAACIRRGVAGVPPPHLPPSEELEERLVMLATAVGGGPAVLLEGPTASGKTTLVLELARICGQRVRIVPITPTTEVNDLLGMYVPWCHDPSDTALQQTIALEIARLGALASEDAMQAAKDLAVALRKGEATDSFVQSLVPSLQGHLKADAHRLLGLMSGSGSMVSFYYAESQLLHAMKKGEWVLFDNIDWGPPAAVERLNSLLEADPSFRVDERGGEGECTLRSNEGIHPNFRVFFTSNPARRHAAKLSEAFRNRVITVAIPEVTTPVNAIFSTITPRGADAGLWYHFLSKVHTEFARLGRGSPRLLQHTLETWGKGKDPSLAALCSAIKGVYIASLPHTTQQRGCDILRRCLTEVHAIKHPKPPTPEAAIRPARKETKSSESNSSSESSSASSSAAEDEEKEEDEEEEEEEEEKEEEEEYLDVKGDDDDGGRACEETVMLLGSAKGGSLEDRDNADFVSCGKAEMQALALELVDMWRSKPGGLLEELLKNLKSHDPAALPRILDNITTSLHSMYEYEYPDLTKMQLLVMQLYTMEGPDTDRLLGFENVPYWKIGGNHPREEVEESHRRWKEYKISYRGKRNTEIYKEVNHALRMALRGTDNDKVKAKVTLQRWIKFICMFLTYTTLPRYTAYRIIADLPPNVMEAHRALAAGDYQGWPSPSSTSLVQSDLFVHGGNNIQFIISNITVGLELWHLSAYPAEREVMLPPFTGFTVRGTRDDPKYLTVFLDCCEVLPRDDPHVRAFSTQVVDDAVHSEYRLKRLLSDTDAEAALSPLHHNLGLRADLPPPILESECEGFTATADPVPQVSDLALKCLSGIEQTATAMIDAYRSLKSKEGKVPKVAWDSLLCDASIDSVVGALEDLLPFNVFTQYKPASSGTGLHIPGLIRAITTNFAYSKVFAAKKGGGKREYSCVISIDTGVFTTDKESRSHFELFATLNSALDQLGVSPAILVHRGKRVHCVKAAGGVWDSLAMSSLITHISHMNSMEPECEDDAHQLQIATSLALEQKGLKRIVFVISNGDTPYTDPLLAKALAWSESLGVQVVAVGFAARVHSAYPKAITISTVDVLGQAIALYRQGPHAHPVAKVPEKGDDEKPEDPDSEFSDGWLTHPLVLRKKEDVGRHTFTSIASATTRISPHPCAVFGVTEGQGVIEVRLEFDPQEFTFFTVSLSGDDYSPSREVVKRKSTLLNKLVETARKLTVVVDSINGMIGWIEDGVPNIRGAHGGTDLYVSISFSGPGRVRATTVRNNRIFGDMIMGKFPRHALDGEEDGRRVWKLPMTKPAAFIAGTGIHKGRWGWKFMVKTDKTGKMSKKSMIGLFIPQYASLRVSGYGHALLEKEMEFDSSDGGEEETVCKFFKPFRANVENLVIFDLTTGLFTVHEEGQRHPLVSIKIPIGKDESHVPCGYPLFLLRSETPDTTFTFYAHWVSLKSQSPRNKDAVDDIALSFEMSPEDLAAIEDANKANDAKPPEEREFLSTEMPEYFDDDMMDDDSGEYSDDDEDEDF